MTSKEHCMSLTAKHDLTLNNSTDFYTNFNLNKSHKCSTAFDHNRLKSAEMENRKSSNYENILKRTAALNKVVDISEKTTSQNDSISLKTYEKNLSKDYFVTNLNDAKEETKARNLSRSNKNSSSTLSLHIAAYENSIEVVPTEIKDLPKKSKAFKPLKPLSNFQDPFEFPRQQKSNESKKSEVQQFKTTQKLFSPNQSASFMKPPRIPKSSNLNFFRVGLPFFAIVFGSAFGLHYFQQVRYDFTRVKKEKDTIAKIHDSLEKAGVKVRKNLTVEDIYQEIAETDTDNWENIRGPREFEDNQQYEEAKKRQKTEAEIRRKALKAKLKEEEALLQQLQQQQKQ